MARRLEALSAGRFMLNIGARSNGFESVLANMGVQSAGAGKLMPAAVQATRYTSQAVFAVAERVDNSYSVHDEPQQRSAQLPSPALPPKLDFDDAQSAFARHSSAAMLRSMGIFSLCSVKPLVRNADAILAYSKGVCGDKMVDAAIKRTLFSHFCAGENPEEVRPLMVRLRASGIGSILAYSVESDVDAVACDTYAAEAQCERHLQKLVESVWAAQTDEGRGFAAVKVTALAQPCMLEEVSRALTAGRPLAELPDRELVLMDTTVARLTHLAHAAHKAGVRLMIDAEHSYFQPAIDLFALELQRHFNTNEAVGYKYLPYGPVGETMPYLVRRAQENSDIMSGVGNDMRLLRAELWRRLRARLPSRGGSAGTRSGPPAHALAA